MVTDCYACEKAQTRPSLKFRGPPDCVSCDARQMALEHGGKEIGIVLPAMHQKWPDTARFKRGRALYWAWIGKINEAKEQA